MAFYKITDPELLQKINNFFDQRLEQKQKIGEFFKSWGFENFAENDSLTFGYRATGMLAPVEQEIDLTKWKTSKFDSRFKYVFPRKSNKNFYAEWVKNRPSFDISYQPLFDLIFVEQPRFYYGTSINWGNKECFLFETNYPVCKEAIEILTSEYKKLSGEIE